MKLETKFYQVLLKSLEFHIESHTVLFSSILFLNLTKSDSFHCYAVFSLSLLFFFSFFLFFFFKYHWPVITGIEVIYQKTHKISVFWFKELEEPQRFRNAIENIFHQK